MDKSQRFLSLVALVLSIVMYLDAVTVKRSLCPTNKIAPHRYASSLREESQSRTLGLLFGPMSPNRPRPTYNNKPNNLQDQSQDDDPNDCGDIEDYDETDISSITRPVQNYIYNKRDHRQIFDGSYDTSSFYQDRNRHHSMHKPRPPQRPQRPIYYPPNRPPFNSQGAYGLWPNGHRPPYQNNPSTPIKPVHENTDDNPQAIYTPGLVGGILGQVVGFPPVVPTFSNERVTSLKKPSTPIGFSGDDTYNKRRPRAKQSNVASDIIGSFVDLFFN
ncbi:unnamed protein product [Arctia plantaginis]|uniref:Uncharacterized protein n=1 Tax=Arctia plantaginis TaxID=874455 RepID=A0A8S1AZ37_ARCPL|nr:unnamed protein product [Arctia plantaginis]